jgi:hypothetical protein
MTNRHLCLVSLLTAALQCSQGLAQAQQRPGDRLRAVESITCTFPVIATGTWKNGTPQAETKSSKLTVAFDEISVEDATARFLGDFGASDIVVRLAGETLHFLQSSRDGPVYLTTIFPRETSGGKLQAVHTRHEWTLVSLPGFTSSPEQYYGDCELKP